MPGLPLTRLQFDPAITGEAIGAGDVAFLHMTFMRQAAADVYSVFGHTGNREKVSVLIPRCECLTSRHKTLARVVQTYAYRDFAIPSGAGKPPPAVI